MTEAIGFFDFHALGNFTVKAGSDQEVILANGIKKGICADNRKVKDRPVERFSCEAGPVLGGKASSEPENAAKGISWQQFGISQQIRPNPWRRSPQSKNRSATLRMTGRQKPCLARLSRSSFLIPHSKVARLWGRRGRKIDAVNSFRHTLPTGMIGVITNLYQGVVKPDSWSTALLLRSLLIILDGMGAVGKTGDVGATGGWKRCSAGCGGNNPAAVIGKPEDSS